MLGTEATPLILGWGLGPSWEGHGEAGESLMELGKSSAGERRIQRDLLPLWNSLTGGDSPRSGSASREQRQDKEWPQAGHGQAQGGNLGKFLH